MDIPVKEHSYKEQYPIFLKETYFAALLESFGIAWDEKKARELEDFYLQEMVTCLAELIQYIDVPDEAKMTALGLSKNFTQEGLLGLKTIFNPLSNDKKAQVPFWTVYTTPTTQALVHYIYWESEINQSEHLNESEILPIIAENKHDFSKTWLALKNYGQTHSEKYAIKAILGRTELAVFDLLSSFSLDKLEKHFLGFTNYGGVDIDDETTWSLPFRCLFLLKKFKKIQKSLSTYIQGDKIGRGSVFIARKPPVRTLPPKRIESFSDRRLELDEFYLMNTSFRENIAATARWSSGWHTLSAGSELKEIYKARYDDHMIVHADYSQAEIRGLAHFAKVTKLLEALANKMDVHRFTAAQIANKTLEQVTDAERKEAKAAVFAILYRKGIINWAREFMRGDVKKTEAFFDGYFGTYPEIKQYMDRNDEQVLRTGMVDSFFGEPLRIDPTKVGVAEAKRQATNYPIQCMASHLAAQGLYHLYEEVVKQDVEAIPLDFVHDAGSWDAFVPTLPRFLHMMDESLVDFIRETYKVPVEIEYDIGVSMYQMMKLFRLENNIYKFSCPEMTFQGIIDRLKLFIPVEFEIKSEKVQQESLKELFAQKRPYCRDIGKPLKFFSGTIQLGE